MDVNPFVGVLFHWLGGASAASFYVPYKRVQRWSWEVYWLTGGAAAWLVVPWVFAALRTNDLLGVLQATPSSTIFWCYFWGAMWGLGRIAFVLTMRYLGLSLGMGGRARFDARDRPARAAALSRQDWGTGPDLERPSHICWNCPRCGRHSDRRTCRTSEGSRTRSLRNNRGHSRV